MNRQMSGGLSESVLVDAEEALTSFRVFSVEDLEQYKTRFLGKGGLIQPLFRDLLRGTQAEKRQWGPRLNSLKKQADSTYKRHLLSLASPESSAAQEEQDLTLSTLPQWGGGRHPISVVLEEVVSIFRYMGYAVADGPEVEDDWHNFGALNFPQAHPARDMQDTFFLDGATDILLRTHTSSTQVRLMQAQEPPFAFLVPGKVYRNETLSARAHCMFHQVEGLYVAEDATFALLRDNLYTFSRQFFGQEVKIRLRPSYFPFTQLSAELDISCVLCGQSGCKLCKNAGWLEIAGCGMVHPRVFAHCKVDAKWTGFAFGIGVERLAMLKYRINDLRLFTINDLRFLDQFRTE